MPPCFLQERQESVRDSRMCPSSLFDCAKPRDMSFGHRLYQNSLWPWVAQRVPPGGRASAETRGTQLPLWTRRVGSGMRIQRRIMCYCRIWATAYRAGPQTRHPNQVFLRCGLGFRHPTKCDFFLWGSAVPDLKIYDPSTSEKDMVEENPGASASAPPTPVPIPVPTTEDKQTSINGDDQEMTDGRNKVRVKRSF